MLRASEVLYRFFTLSGIASLGLSLWAAPHFEATQQPEFFMSLALYNAIGICPGLVFLQFVTGFYLAVRKYEKPANWKLLLLGSLLAGAVFWANLVFGVAKPFFDSWD